MPSAVVVAATDWVSPSPGDQVEGWEKEPHVPIQHLSLAFDLTHVTVPLGLSSPCHFTPQPPSNVYTVSEAGAMRLLLSLLGCAVFCQAMSHWALEWVLLLPFRVPVTLGPR